MAPTNNQGQTVAQSDDMVFDSQPVSQPTTATSTQTPPSASDDITFDAQPVRQSTAVSAVQGPQPQPQQQFTPTAIISATPQPTTASGKVERWARNVADDLRYGTDLTGIGTVLKKMGAHGIDSEQPGAGEMIESLPLGLTQLLTGIAETAQSGKRWQGAKDAAGGALNAATVPSAFVAPEGAELAGQGADALGSAASKATNAVSNTLKAATDPQAVQQPLQQGIRNILSSAAKDAGINLQPSASIRDAVSDLSAAVKAKGSAIYKQLDAATGGRFQRFQDALDNIEKGLNESLGVDPDKHDALLQRKGEVEAAQQSALDQAKANGTDPSLIQKANQLWKQSSALSDLSNSLRQTVTGLRPELATGAKSSPETVNAKTLFSKINRLNDKRRLADAIGPENASALLQHVDSMYLAAQKIANRNETIKSVAKAVGLGGLGYGVMKEAHNFFEPQ